ncbi:MAG: lytic murein transglycosylase [Mesorhizobium sp.]|nr:MAG: lytic murein transglycosylase [Mesorhizobium sp.]RWM46974.1 MAG: lytic murein transglycosylase [Mesorhizobium sp.]RWM47105.1 MAG: lytic murein transglycosylase [Mesorhizobium sp.]RWM55076.1 MAG: lytic murein transglycosylase [Mesorhizobium sp.]RWM90649.1 MAG: lytic murein transglycosylase [Mesorhizobium sp.]
MRSAPLCPAGHLPLEGEIIRSTAFANRKRWKADGAPKLPISHLEGEMSGRTEGVLSLQLEEPTHFSPSCLMK